MKLLHNNHAQMSMIGVAVGLLITLMIVIVIYYNISASINTSHVDAAFNRGKVGWLETGTNGSRPATNATTQINNQAATFFTIAPIIAIVIVAVVVIGYVQRIGG